jgi:RimJ/RimL family protein N-acetyltransferase
MGPIDRRIVVRPAREADAAAMAAYMTQLTAEGLDTISQRRPPSLEDEREWVLKAALSERAVILLALDGDEVVGALDLWGGERADDGHAGRLGMSVAQAWRRRGVGERLLRAAIDEARGWPGFCRIELEVAPWNAPAVALYERLGFLHEGRKIKALDLRGRPEDMLIMALTW